MDKYFKNIRYGAILLSSMLALTACDGSKKDTSELTSIADTAITVTEQLPDVKTLSSQSNYIGTVEADSTVYIIPKVSAEVLTKNFEVGDHVEAGDLLFTLDDSKQAAKAGENKNLYIIHDDDLLRVVNELRSAGAEAISLNGQRLIGSSEIRCVGPTVLVNERRLAAPFVISAIGNPQTLESSLKLRGGVIENFKFWGIKADVVQSDKVRIPAFQGKRTFEFAKMVTEEEKKEDNKETVQAAENKKETAGNAQAKDNKVTADAGKEQPADRRNNAGGGAQ